ncbi:MAG: GNAT family N-acetyltransferase [Steroidobacteraceae bacterium]
MRLLTGGCQCGAVRYRISGEVLSHVVCHCESCRRTTGALMVPWFTVLHSALTLTQGRLAVRNSSPGVRRGRCLACGTALTYEASDEAPVAERTIDVTTCSLDEPAALQPDAHIWMADGIPWERGAAHLPRYPFLRGHGWIEPALPLGLPGIRLRQVAYAGYRDTLLSVRMPVFVEEQKVPAALEEDDRDPHCLHLLALHDDRAVATARLDLQGQGRIGRLAVLPAYRDQGLGRALLLTLEALARAAQLPSVWCHAQLAALPFYERLGYRREGEAFAEAGLPHVRLRKSLS